MKRLVALGTAGLLMLTACGGGGGSVTTTPAKPAAVGTVIEKDADPAKTKKVKKCTRVKKRNVCKKVTKTIKAADYDITVRYSDGSEQEIDITKVEFDRIQINDPY